MNDRLRKIAKLAVPAVVTNVTTPLLALCDVAVTGHMGNAVYLAAIAVGGTMFNMLYWLFGFLRMGASGTTAQALGAKDRVGVKAIFCRGLVLAIAGGLLLIAFHKPLSGLILSVIDATGSTRALATDYFNICIWGAPAMLGTFSLTGWLLGMQNSRIPMWVSIIINVLNISISLTLVYGFGMGIEGVATGTLSAQWAGFIITLAAALHKYGMPRVGWQKIFDRNEMRKFFRINSDIFLRTVCLVAITIWFTRIGAIQGNVMLAVNTLLMQLFTIFSYMMDGIAFAGEALCGLNKGARDYTELHRTVKTLSLLGLICSAIFTLIYFLFGDSFLSLLSSDKEVVSRSHEFFYWAVSIPLVSVMAFVMDGVMIGLTRTRAMLASMIVGAGVYFGLYFWLFPLLGNHGLWIAFLSYLFVRGLMLTVLYLYSERYASHASASSSYHS